MNYALIFQSVFEGNQQSAQTLDLAVTGESVLELIQPYREKANTSGAFSLSYSDRRTHSAELACVILACRLAFESPVGRQAALRRFKSSFN